MKKFVGRKKELNYFREIYNSNKSEFVILYGRRRLGKSELLKKSLENINGVYFLSTQQSSIQNQKSFAKTLSNTLNSKVFLRENETFLEYFENIADVLPKRFTIIIDEFPFLISDDKSITSQFQKIYDEILKDKEINLVLCGSSISIMTDIQSYSSPLYGRRTGSIKLEAFTLRDTKEYFKEVNNLEEILKYHLTFGGIPYYLEQVDTQKTYNENIEKMFFKGTSLFLDEVTFLLKEEFREIKNYLQILNSISRGKNKFSNIAQDSLIDKSSLSKYLINLETLNLVKNEKSFFDKENSKKTIYKIEDNFIFFFFNVISNNLSSIENLNIQEQILQQLIPKALGYLFEKEITRILSKKYEKIGTYFNKEIEIDILGKNENTIDVIECKFRKNSNELKIIEELKKKSSFLPKQYKYKFKVISTSNDEKIKEIFQL